MARDAVPTEGRDVQCSNCGLTWLAKPPPKTESDTESETRAAVAPPAPRSTITPEIAEILRAEAEREAAARRRGAGDAVAQPVAAPAREAEPTEPTEPSAPVREPEPEKTAELDPAEAAGTEVDAGPHEAPLDGGAEAGDIDGSDDEREAASPEDRGAFEGGSEDVASDGFEEDLAKVTEALREADTPSPIPRAAEPSFNPFDEGEDEEIDFASVLSQSATQAPAAPLVDSRDLWEEDDDETDLTQIARKELSDPVPPASGHDDTGDRDEVGPDVDDDDDGDLRLEDEATYAPRDDDDEEDDDRFAPVENPRLSQADDATGPEAWQNAEPVTGPAERPAWNEPDDDEDDIGDDTDDGLGQMSGDEDDHNDEDMDEGRDDHDDLTDPALMASLSAEDPEDEDLGASQARRTDVRQPRDETTHEDFEEGDHDDWDDEDASEAPITAHEAARERASMAAASTGAVTRRDLLPDIEEINSSLRSTAMRGGSPRTVESTDVQRGRGFRLGFGTVLLIAAALALVYAHAGRIGAALPPLDGPLQSYAVAVDGLRGQLDAWLRGLLETLG